MSSIAVNAITNAAGGNTATINGMTPTADSLQGFRNRIINGDMRIDQRNAGSSVTPTVNGTYTLDRWKTSLSQASKYSVQQNAGSVTPPVGFTNYLGVTSTSAYSVASGDFFMVQQPIEGFNTADLGWGTANAKAITISFWVRSSLTGTFGGVLYNSAGDRSYPFTYTISSANTWEQKSVTIAGDTSGTWLTTNGVGVWVNFGLGVGSTYSGTAGSWSGTLYFSATGAVSVVGTSGATFYLTGVQLEAGSVATPFERRPYGTELQLAQRYFFKWEPGNGNVIGTFQAYSATAVIGTFCYLPVQMRTAPTVTFSDASHFRAMNASAVAANTFSSLPSGMQNTVISISTASGWAGTSGLSAGNATQISAANASCAISASSEL